MGGSSKQTIGYKYFGGMMVVIGNRIEKLLNINADNRGWMLNNDQKKILDSGNATIVIDNPNLFGGSNQEGGWIGVVDVCDGSQTESNEYLKKQIDPDISAYPNLSYMVFRGYDSIAQSENLNKGFELVSMSGMLKDFMLWVKRTRIKNDGNGQWYERNLDGEIVCEIDARYTDYKDSPILATKFNQSNKMYLNGIENNKFEFSGDFVPDQNDDEDTIISDNSRSSLSISYRDYKGQSDTSRSSIQFNTDVDKLFARVIIKYSAVGNEHSFNNNLSILKINSENSWKEHEINAGTGLPNFFETNFYEIDCIAYISDLSISSNSKGSIAQYPSSDPTLKDAMILSSSAKLTVFAPKSLSGGETVAPDINPIHKIREIITDYTAMGKSELLINDGNFAAMADRIYSEGLGISWCIQEKSCKDALDELLYHIEAGLRINRQTGLYEVVLFRDDLIYLDEALIFNESNIKEISFDIANLDESVSSINVSYYDRELIKDSSFLLYENGLERTRGFSISENIDFPYFMNRINAEIVGNWKLKQLSSPTWKGSFKTGVSEARRINKYDVVKLSWKSKNLVNLPVRILNINLGDGVNNTVTLDFVEVIPYSNIEYTKTNVDNPIDDRLTPKSNSNIAFEMPYLEAIQRFTQTQVDLELGSSPDLGYLMASAARPQNNSLNAQLFTDNGTGFYANISRVGVVDYCPAVYIDQDIGYLDTIIKIKNLDYVDQFGVSGFSGATKGTWILLNDEIMVFDSFDGDTMEIFVKRGALDTIPKKHTSGIIFFSDEFSGIDQNQYIYGETVKYQVLTTTPSSIEQLEAGKTKEILFKSRAIRPYPPANIKFNNLYYPETIVMSGDIILTWVDRNRLQQTGGEILGFFDNGITVEPNVSYSVDISVDGSSIISSSGINSNSYTINKNILTPNKAHKIKLWSVRDGYDSYQVFEHNVFIEAVSLILSATVSKDKVVGSTVPQANINVSVDESLSANMKFDGSSIKGKALPNSTIIIEVQE